MGSSVEFVIVLSFIADKECGILFFDEASLKQILSVHDKLTVTNRHSCVQVAILSFSQTYISLFNQNAPKKYSSFFFK